jgi:CheY-like chemotaxis protein
MNELILIVEDEEDIAQVMRYNLQKAGYRTVVASDGEQALRAVRFGEPDLVLLDLMLPEMDGFEFVEAFRRHESWRSIPVVVLTARDLSAEDHQRLNGRVQRIVQKGTWTREALLREVRELMTASLGRRAE